MAEPIRSIVITAEWVDTPGRHGDPGHWDATATVDGKFFTNATRMSPWVAMDVLATLLESCPPYEDGAAEAEPEPPTNGMLRAFHAMIRNLAVDHREVEPESLKAAVLAEESERLGRRILSSRDLTRDEMGEVLDRLSGELDARRALEAAYRG